MIIVIMIMLIIAPREFLKIVHLLISSFLDQSFFFQTSFTAIKSIFH